MRTNLVNQLKSIFGLPELDSIPAEERTEAVVWAISRSTTSPWTLVAIAFCGIGMGAVHAFATTSAYELAGYAAVGGGAGSLLNRAISSGLRRYLERQRKPLKGSPD